MARGRRRGRGRPREERGAPQQATLAGALPGLFPYDDTPLGVGNIIRHFSFGNTEYNSPYVIFEQCFPWSGFTQGYGFAGDKAGALNYSEAAVNDATTYPRRPAPTGFTNWALYPITEVAKVWNGQIWPSLITIIESGTGARPELKEDDAIQYFARLVACYRLLYSALVINHLVFHYDWKQTWPYTDTVPPWIYKIAQNLDLSDANLVDLWLPLMQRMEVQILPPGFIPSIKRMLTPYYASDLGGRLHVPTSFDDAQMASATGGEGARNLIEGYLNGMDIELKEFKSLAESFLPFPVAPQGPWDVSAPMMDPDRMFGVFNSGINTPASWAFTQPGPSEANTAFGSIWQTRTTNATQWDGSTYFLSPLPIPTWSMVKLGTLYQTYTDDKPATVTALPPSGWRLLTPHRSTDCWIFADDDTYQKFDTEIPDSSSDGNIRLLRYMELLNRRFRGYPGTKATAPPTDNKSWGFYQGFIKPGMLTAEIPMLALRRQVVLEAEAVFAYSALRYVQINMVGSSIRTIRETITRIVSAAT